MAEKRKRGNPAGQSDLLSKEIADSGMIKAGSHPEFEKPTPLDNLVAFGKKLLRGKPKLKVVKK